MSQQVVGFRKDRKSKKTHPITSRKRKAQKVKPARKPLRVTPKKSKRQMRFVVQEHHASNLHYDFRLELNGTLRSWAVPKVPPTTPGIRRLAIPVEDHPLSYINFEGTIPKDEYGAGTVKIWDKGTYVLTYKRDNSLKFTFNGRKMKGNYVLFKLPNRKEWLLVKEKE